MNEKALLQLGSELMFQFRHDSGAADRSVALYLRDRKFLGAKDKRFLANVFYHTLRNLRRYDEAIMSGFNGTIIARERFYAGFPVNSEIGARAWHRELKRPAEEQAAKRFPIDRAIDSLRMGLAAIELDLMPLADVTEELHRAWPPQKKSRLPMAIESVERMVTRTLEVATLYKNSTKPIDMDRTLSFPAWLWSQLAHGYTVDSLNDLANSLNKQAPFSLRVNTLKTTMAKAEEALKSASLEFGKTTIAPEALVLQNRVSRSILPNSGDGWFEVQDAGSQVIGRYIQAEKNAVIIDACAGAGGKALHIAALLDNKCQIIALDIDKKRLESLERRAEKCGVTCIDTSIPLGPKGMLPSKELLPSVEMVIVDAPCSSTGTLRRNPENRWRLTPSILSGYQETQRTLLARWAERLNPGGLIVYATCSLLASENELQIDRFLEGHPDFTLEAPQGDDTLPLTKRGELKLLPHQYSCDGFYAARLRKKG